MKTLLNNFFFLILFISISFAEILNVPSANYPTIQAAIDSALVEDTVLVDEGTYYENINFKGKAITVASHFYVDEDSSHIENTTIDGSQPENPDSGSVVYCISGEDTNSVLYGFTITHGTGTITEYDWRGNTYPIRAGGGIFCYNSGCRVQYNTIVNNTIPSYAEASGGGISAIPFGSKAYIIIDSNQIKNNSITGNDAAFGGGIGVGCNGKIISNSILSNSCYTGINGQAAGGGVDLSSEVENRSMVLLEKNRINHNSANGTQVEGYPPAFGGGISVYGTNTQISGNEICYNKLSASGNENVYGVGLCMQDVQNISQVNGNKISYNTVISGIGRGGGIYLIEASPQIMNNLISGNEVMVAGGILIYRNSNIQLVNNTIVDNLASQSSGGIRINNSNPVIFNTIIWGNQATIGPSIELISGNCTVRYCDIQDGWIGEGNINSDPGFLDTLCNLCDSSFCVGNGIDSVEISSGVWYTCPKTDFNGDPRPNPIDEYVDMGAIESPHRQVPLSIEAEELYLPYTFKLYKNFPNPFNPTTKINYELPIANYVDLSIYNLLGQKVVTLVNERQQPGHHQVLWDASEFASGVYYYRIEAGEFQDVKKMILIK
jgi:hypothetical protein